MIKEKSIKSISQRLKVERERLGYTQAKFAAESEITPAAISQFESGYRIPSTPILRKLASVLGVSTDYLLGKTDKSEIQDLLQDEKIQSFFRGYRDLSSDDKKIIERQIEFMRADQKK